MAQAPTQYLGLRAEEQRTKLFVPHSGGELTFSYPAYGLGTYANVGLAIKRDKLSRPTMAESASLVHAAFNSPTDDRYRKEIKDILSQVWLWGFTGTLYVPKEGAFIQDDPEIRQGMPFMDKDGLEQKLNAKDPNVRFVPFGYKVGEMSPLELAKNPYIIGLAGEEGAEKLAKVAEAFKLYPYLWSFDSVDKPQTRVSALYSWDLDQRLVVDGDYLGDGRGGRAFGVLDKTGGASLAPKNNNLY